MRKLVLILITFLAVATFIRAFDQRGGELAANDIAEPVISESLSE